jgi:hypothetical protein
MSILIIKHAISGEIFNQCNWYDDIDIIQYITTICNEIGINLNAPPTKINITDMRFKDDIYTVNFIYLPKPITVRGIFNFNCVIKGYCNTVEDLRKYIKDAIELQYPKYNIRLEYYKYYDYNYIPLTDNEYYMNVFSNGIQLKDNDEILNNDIYMVSIFKTEIL